MVLRLMPVSFAICLGVIPTFPIRNDIFSFIFLGDDPSEILGLEWKDLKDSSISISKPCKGHYSGIAEVSPRCIAMLRALPKTDKRVFPVTYDNIYSDFRSFRKRAAQQLQNDQLLNITFKTFRHWGGTEIAIRTNGNGLLTIQKTLRHKDIKSTMKYIHNLPNFKEVEYEIATATTDEEIKALGKAGFEKYDEAKGIHYYRRIPRKNTWFKPK
jgi:integrase